MKIPVALELKLPGHIGAFHASEPFADMEYLGRPGFGGRGIRV